MRPIPRHAGLEGQRAADDRGGTRVARDGSPCPAATAPMAGACEPLVVPPGTPSRRRSSGRPAQRLAARSRKHKRNKKNTAQPVPSLHVVDLLGEHNAPAEPACSCRTASPRRSFDSNKALGEVGWAQSSLEQLRALRSSRYSPKLTCNRRRFRKPSEIRIQPPYYRPCRKGAPDITVHTVSR